MDVTPPTSNGTPQPEDGPVHRTQPAQKATRRRRSTFFDDLQDAVMALLTLIPIAAKLFRRFWKKRR